MSVELPGIAPSVEPTVAGLQAEIADLRERVYDAELQIEVDTDYVRDQCAGALVVEADARRVAERIATRLDESVFDRATDSGELVTLLDRLRDIVRTLTWQ